MEAIVLAGGFGTRLRHVVPDLPKPMAPVAGKPFLEILLGSLSRKGFIKVVLSLGYMADKIISHFGSRFMGMDLVYEVEDLPLGTGGAVRQAVRHCNADHVFVLNGDTYLDFEVASVESKWQRRKVPIIVARVVSDATRYGCLSVSGGKVIGFSEKGIAGPGLINAGVYVLPTNALNAFVPGKNFSLEADFLEKAVETEHFDIFVSKGYFIDIGVPEDFTRAQTELLGICSR